MKNEIELNGFGERLKSLRAGFSQGEFAEKIGISQGALSAYERGDRLPNMDVLLKINESLKVSIDWLVTGEAPLTEGQCYIPLLSPKILGFPEHLLADMNISSYIMFWRTFVDMVSNGTELEYLALVQIKGDAMAPTFPAGSLVMIDLRAGGFGNNGVFAYLNDGFVTVNRFQNMTNGLIIKNDNPKYDDEILTPEQANDVKVIGRVISAISPV